jgi:hypothetical protein
MNRHSDSIPHPGADLLMEMSNMDVEASDL